MNFFQPIRGFFTGTQFSAKLLWIIAVFTIPVAVPTYFLLSDFNDQIDFAKSELLGVDYFQAVRQAAAPIIEHRRLANDSASANNSGRVNLKPTQTRVEDAFKGIVVQEQRIGANPHTAEAWDKVQKGWAAVKAKVDSPPGPQKQAELFALHNKLLEDLSDLMTEAADTSKLTLDPEYGSYALHMWLQKVIEGARYFGEAQGLGQIALGRGRVTTEEKDQFAVLVAKAGLNQKEMESGWEDIYKEAKRLSVTMEPLVKDLDSKRDDFLECLGNDLFRAEAPKMTREKLIEEGNAVIDASFKLYDASEPQLIVALSERVSGLRTRIVVTVVAVGVGYMAVLAVAFFILRGVTRQIGAMKALFTQIREGDFNARAAVITRDEIGQMAELLNENILPLVQSHDERNRIQLSIQKLLDEVSGLAEGDLTKEAEVTADITGALADSFNYMIDQLRLIIGNVKDATEQLGTSAAQITSTATHLAEGSENQADQIVNTSAAIDEIAVSIQQVSENATQSAAVATQALSNARQGNEAVQNTIQGMSRIREQVQETAKRIKRLGESSQEIGQIIQLIDDIADRTSILALNASIQAAAAGEAGRGFAVVAAEVERLAERSTDATKKIGTLVKTIQGETNEAVAAMEKGINEVVEGSKLANQAGKSLHEIEGVSQRLAELIQSISLAASQQARGSEALSKSMAGISQITQQTAAGTKQAAESVGRLASLADELRGSVSAFRLPGQNGQANGHTTHHNLKPVKV